MDTFGNRLVVFLILSAHCNVLTNSRHLLWSAFVNYTLPNWLHKSCWCSLVYWPCHDASSCIGIILKLFLIHLKIFYWFCLTSFLGGGGRNPAHSLYPFCPRRTLSLAMIRDLMALYPDCIACLITVGSSW